MGASVAGTTDIPAKLSMHPVPTKDEVSFILNTMNSALDVPIDKNDVRSAWTGLRPLASDPSKSNTESIVRDHVCFVEDTGLISITGGKWTTFRKMAQDAVDLAISVGQLKPVRDSCTQFLLLDGAIDWQPTLNINLAKALYTLKKHSRKNHNLDVPAVASRLSKAYGSNSWDVLNLGKKLDLLKPLSNVGEPILEAEVVYTARHEFCMTASDFLARRCRLAFTDTEAARAILPRVIDLLAKEFKWGTLRCWKERRDALSFLKTFEQH